MTQDELAESIDRAVQGFSSIAGVQQELAERLVEEGFLSYDDLSIIEPDALMEMGGLSEEQVDEIVAQAEERAEEAEAAAAAARKQKREEDRIAAATAAEEAPPDYESAAPAEGGGEGGPE
jgi:N utilization substance protein A